MRRLSAAAGCALGLGLVGIAPLACRDAADPFQPVDRHAVPDPTLRRLTWSPADDRGPIWSAGGDSIYFTASRYDANPLAPATVLALPASGMGSVTTVLRNVQEGTGRTNWIAAPALSDDGERVAFIRVRTLLPESPCVGKRVCPMTILLPMVRLIAAEVHARQLDAVSGLADDDILPLQFEGRGLESDSTVPGGVITLSEYHPFQLEFEIARRPFFRPAWNPDGTELVVSDGLRLLRWVVGPAAPVAIAGTEDGMVPAWSPNGEWIAYARYARTSSQTFTCEYQNEHGDPPVPITACVERRTIHNTAAPQIVLVRPDGSGEQVLGQGTDPAWSPDGQHVYASALVEGAPMVVRMPLGDGPIVVIPRTERAASPAVSPDGRRLAFSRPSVPADMGMHDIWVLELP